jgi:hypothetical protein
MEQLILRAGAHATSCICIWSAVNARACSLASQRISPNERSNCIENRISFRLSSGAIEFFLTDEVQLLLHVALDARCSFPITKAFERLDLSPAGDNQPHLISCRPSRLQINQQ